MVKGSLVRRETQLLTRLSKPAVPLVPSLLCFVRNFSISSSIKSFTYPEISLLWTTHRCTHWQTKLSCFCCDVAFVAFLQLLFVLYGVCVRDEVADLKVPWAPDAANGATRDNNR